MLPACPHCQKNIPIVPLINARNLKACPNCQKSITPKLNWVKALGGSAATLIAVAVILFTILGESQIVTFLGAVSGIVAFYVFGYSFDKKDDV